MNQHQPNNHLASSTSNHAETRRCPGRLRARTSLRIASTPPSLVVQKELELSSPSPKTRTDVTLPLIAPLMRAAHGSRASLHPHLRPAAPSRTCSDSLRIGLVDFGESRSSFSAPLTMRLNRITTRANRVLITAQRCLAPVSLRFVHHQVLVGGLIFAHNLRSAMSASENFQFLAGSSSRSRKRSRCSSFETLRKNFRITVPLRAM